MDNELFEQVSSRLASFFSNKPEICFAYLFGSVSQGTAGKLSDIDLAVFLAPLKRPPTSRYGYASELAAELSSLLRRAVDLVILNEASTMIKYQVLKYGKQVYCRSEEQRRIFHETAVRNYLDLKPLFKVQNYYLHKRIASGTFGGESTGRS